MAGRLRNAWNALTTQATPEPERKASATGTLAYVQQGGVIGFTGWHRHDHAEHAMGNVISRLCVRLVADAFAVLPLLLFRGEDEVEPTHPLAVLLDRPNPLLGRARFMQALAGHQLINENSWIEAVRPRPTQPPRELYCHNPGPWEIIHGVDGLPRTYRFRGDKGWRDFPIDPRTGRGDVLHIAGFNPLPHNSGHGLSPMEAAARWVSLDNAGADLNITLARGINPSLAIGIEVEDASEDEAARLRTRVVQRIEESRQNGVPLVTLGKLNVQKLADSLQDMQWSEGMHEAGRRICSAWNVPHVLVIPGESTYANRETAHLELWEHTVLPFAHLLLDDLIPWLRHLYQDDSLDLRVDVDAISALEPRRQTVRQDHLLAFEKGMLSLNEARLAWGYEPAEENEESPGDEPAALRNARQASMLAQAQSEALTKPDEQQGNRNPFPGQPATGGRDDGEPPEDEEEDEEEDEDGKSVRVIWDEAAKAWRVQPRYPAGTPLGGRFAPLGPDKAPMIAGTSPDWRAFERYLREGTRYVPPADPPEPEPPPTAPVPPRPRGGPPGTGGNPEPAISPQPPPKPKAADPWSDETKARSFPDFLPDGLLVERALPVVRRVLARFGKAVVDKLQLQISFDVDDPRVLKYLENWGGERIKELVGTTTRKELGEAIAGVAREGGRLPDAVAAIRGVFTRATETRAETIALTETIAAASYGTLEGMQQGGVERSSWVSSRDQAVRPHHRSMDGQVQELGELFVAPTGEKGRGPGLFPSAAMSVNCRCFLLPLPDGDDGTKADRDLEWKAASDEADPLIEEMRQALVAGFAAQQRAMIVAAGRHFG